MTEPTSEPAAAGPVPPDGSSVPPAWEPAPQPGMTPITPPPAPGATPPSPPAPPAFGSADASSPFPGATPPRSSGWGGGLVSRGLVAVLAPVLAVVMFAGGVFVERAANSGTVVVTPTATPAASPGGSATPDEELALIEQAWHAIHDNYVDPKSLDSQKMAYAAIRGLTDAVGDDGHTSFMTAEEAKASDQSLSGTFVGIGVQVAEDNGSVIITSVIPNTPAEEAGLQRKDKILAVDGVSTAGKTVDEVVSVVRGPEGEKVTLTLGRVGTADFDVTITRRSFDLPLITWSMVPGRHIAMIRLDQFSTGATKALEDAIKGAKDQGATAIIFDLRENPGGYVNEAVGVASQFVGDGIVFKTIDRGGTQKDEPVQPGGLATDIPMVVLADGGTASSAEIVTGAIQDAQRGQVVGVKTFGTGTVLGRFDLADGSVLRIGTERWLTRGGRPIWHEGLDPDVKVELPTTATMLVPNALKDMTETEVSSTTDVQFAKALELLVGKG